MGMLMSALFRGGTSITYTGAAPRINPRTGRGVEATSPDHAAIGGPANVPVLVSSVQPAEPFLLRTLPKRRIGPVPKLAPGKQGSGLGQHVAAGFQSAYVYGFTPLESGPANNPAFTLRIPRGIGLVTEGRELAPTYRAYDFAPATRQFDQARSAGAWAQAEFAPQFRPLTPSQQGVLLQRPAVRRQIPAAQANAGLYTFGYPTRIGVAARLGGGPVAVLGGNSQ